jgi:Ca2+-binding EF-hand superfamily protein
MAAVNRRKLVTSESLNRVFKMFDQDNNGYLELDDFKIMFGNHYSDERIEKLIKEVDENHD